jgi:hypothetical protein
VLIRCTFQVYLIVSGWPYLLGKVALVMSVPHILVVGDGGNFHLPVELFNILLVRRELIKLGIPVLVPPIFKREGHTCQRNAHENDDEYTTWKSGRSFVFPWKMFWQRGIFQSPLKFICSNLMWFET